MTRGSTKVPFIFKMYTLQSIFDTVWNHFIVNETLPGMDVSGACAYKAGEEPNCRKCAVGILIPDELYEPEMEGEPASTLVTSWDSLIPLFSQIPEDFIDDLQHAHDDSIGADLPFHKKFELSLLMLASQYELMVPGV